MSVQPILLCIGEHLSVPSMRIWLDAMDANKVTMYEIGQMVDPITLHKENDSDGWPQWLDVNQSREVAL